MAGSSLDAVGRERVCERVFVDFELDSAFVSTFALFDVPNATFAFFFSDVESSPVRGLTFSFSLFLIAFGGGFALVVARVLLEAGLGVLAVFISPLVVLFVVVDALVVL